MSATLENRPDGQGDTPVPTKTRTVTVPSIRDAFALPTVVDLPTAGQYFGLSADQSYALHRAKQFPVRVLTLGKRHRVRTADLLRELGLPLTA